MASIRNMSAYTDKGYINWPLVMSFDAPITLVIDARTRGKTFGLRWQFISDYVKRGTTFAELVRHKEQLQHDDKIQNGYFDKFYSEMGDSKYLKRYLFRTQGTHAYAAKVPDDGSKPIWDVMGYFLALSDADKIKERSHTFKRVKRYVLDEALIDKSLPGARFREYLPGEIAALSSIVTSVSRENRSTPKEALPRIYLMGNSVDLTCPYLTRFGITDVPSYGFSWHYDKRVLLWYGAPDPDWIQYQSSTVASALMGDSDLVRTSVANEFTTLDASFFAKPSKDAKFSFGVIYRGDEFGIWCDMREGYYYVMPKLPKDTDNRPVYALTMEDARPNVIMARRAQKSLKGFVDLYYAGIVRYHDHDTRQRFLQAMSLFGIR